MYELTICQLTAQYAAQMKQQIESEHFAKTILILPQMLKNFENLK